MHTVMNDYMYNDIHDVLSVVMWNKFVNIHKITPKQDAKIRGWYNYIMDNILLRDITESRGEHIENLLATARKDLTPSESEMLDVYMLSTLETRSKQEIIDSIAQKLNRARGLTKDEVLKRMNQISKMDVNQMWKLTHSARLGQLVRTLSPRVLQSYYQTLEKLFKPLLEKITPTDASRFFAEELTDSYWTNYTADDRALRFNSAFSITVENAKKKYKSINELRKNYDAIDKLFKNIMRHPDWQRLMDGDNLLQFMRFLTSENFLTAPKDLSQMTMRDIENMNNWFEKYLYKDTLVEKLFARKKNLNKPGVAWFYDMFMPKTIAKRMLRHNLASFNVVAHGGGPLAEPLSHMNELINVYNYMERNKQRAITASDDRFSQLFEELLSGTKLIETPEGRELRKQIINTAWNLVETVGTKNGGGGGMFTDTPAFKEYEKKYKALYEHLQTIPITETQTAADLVEIIAEGMQKHNAICYEFIHGPNELWESRDKVNIELARKYLLSGKFIGNDPMRFLIWNDFTKQKGAGTPRPTGYISGYMPHIFDTTRDYIKATERFLAKTRKEMMQKVEAGEMTAENMERELSIIADKLNRERASRVGRGILDSPALSMIDAEEELKDDVDWGYSLSRVSKNMLTRGTNLDGYSTDVIQLRNYKNSLVNTYYTSRYAYEAEKIITRFRDQMSAKDPQLAEAFESTQLRRYVRDTIGLPSIYRIGAKQFGFGQYPYGQICDQRIAERWNKFIKHIPFLKRLEITSDNIDALQNLATAEARFESWSLLASARFYVNNFLGGDTNTMISVGFEPWRKALVMNLGGSNADKYYSQYQLTKYKVRNADGKIEYVTAGDINTTGRKALSQLYIDSGIYQSFLKQEVGIYKEFSIGTGKDFFNDMLTLAKTRELTKKDVWELAAKHRISEKASRFASKFIGSSEASLRKRSFLAHYIAARDNNYPQEAAIEVALRGVEASQFLYDMGNRPAFSRTAVGQILTRFMHWSWNSVAFRKQILNARKIYGLDSASGERLKRMLTIDMFVMALGSAFLSSVFESSLPAPYNWIQDTAELIFGDEKERERAFAGSPIGPLSIVAAPITRIPVSALGAIFTGSWDRFLQYHIWTAFPFGRLSREVLRTARTPEMLPEFMFGVPVHEFSRLRKKMMKEEPAVKWSFF